VSDTGVDSTHRQTDGRTDTRQRVGWGDTVEYDDDQYIDCSTRLSRTEQTAARQTNHHSITIDSLRIRDIFVDELYKSTFYLLTYLHTSSTVTYS